MEIRRKDYAFLVAFVSATFLSIVFMTVILPNIVFQPQPSQFVVDLNEKQLRGRDIYKREGCVYCHSQFVRPQDRNGGPVSLAGDFEFYPETVERAKQMDIQLPHLLGTLRTGPDLTNIGGLMSDAWHKAHHRNPRAFNPGSVMPSFDYLSEEEMDDLVAYIQTLGVKKNELSRKYQAEYAGNFNEAYELADGQAQEESYAYLIEPDVPYEFKVFYQKKYRNVNPVKYANRYIAGARGIYNTKCATCHGVHGDGNGPRNLALTEKPANFQSNDPNMGYDQWSDIKWYWKIAEGAGPGAVMPRWNGILEPDQIWYLVQYCKYLAADRVMPDAPRWMPLMPEGYLPPTYHFEGDDLIVRMPSRPAGTSATEPAYIPDVQVQTGRP
ncbi:MAG TPA: cbb3-type cytochrome c oxidase subunit II, partial [bacterium]|nr:cbb3-type cytochrome c oxidase subunit II [bacterium]